MTDSPELSPKRSFQGLILTLQTFWAEQGCVILQPYDMEMGAGTFHPATTLRALGPKPWKAAYVQPSRRPKDGRYGENPNRLQHYYQFQVILKPSPDDIQDLYLQLARRDRHRLRSCTTSASSRTIGRARRSAPGASAGSAGATGWRFRSSPISSRSRASSARRFRANSPTVSSASRCTCRASRTCYDLNFNGREGNGQGHLRRRVPAGRAGISRATISSSPTPRCCSATSRTPRTSASRCSTAGDKGKRHELALPAYDQCIKASHAFNLLDARGVISVTERQSYILRVRELAKACGAAWLKTAGGGAA